GHSWLVHSMMTVLPRYAASVCCAPLESVAVKSGAGLPVCTAAPAGAFAAIRVEVAAEAAKRVSAWRRVTIIGHPLWRARYWRPPTGGERVVAGAGRTNAGRIKWP